MKVRSIALILGLLIPAAGFAAEGTTTCLEQTAQGHKAELCLHEPGLFKHFHFVLTVDGEQIFSLVDDYAEDFSLIHKVPQGPALEFPLSKQGMNPITIKGSCKPVLNADGAEAGIDCNIKWGKIDIVKNARFSVK